MLIVCLDSFILDLLRSAASCRSLSLAWECWGDQIRMREINRTHLKFPSILPTPPSKAQSIKNLCKNHKIPHNHVNCTLSHDLKSISYKLRPYGQTKISSGSIKSIPERFVKQLLLFFLQIFKDIHLIKHSATSCISGTCSLVLN